MVLVSASLMPARRRVILHIALLKASTQLIVTQSSMWRRQWPCIVTDHFTEWSTYLHSVSSNVTQRLLYPALLPLSIHASPTTRGKRGDQVQWVIDRTCLLPLKWESLTYRNSHAFIMDTGDMLVLYKTSTPPVFRPAPPASAQQTAGNNSVPPPSSIPIPPPAPASAAAPVSTPAVVKTGPRAEVGFGLKALDVLGHIDRGVGRLIGDPTFDESYEDARSGEEESKTNDNLEATAGEKEKTMTCPCCCHKSSRGCPMTLSSTSPTALWCQGSL